MAAHLGFMDDDGRFTPIHAIDAVSSAHAFMEWFENGSFDARCAEHLAALAYNIMLVLPPETDVVHADTVPFDVDKREVRAYMEFAQARVAQMLA